MQDIFNKCYKYAKENNYKIFEKDNQPYNFNLWAIRNKDINSNKFNDLFIPWYKFDGEIYLYTFQFTTDAGSYYRKNPMNPKGCAYLPAGQYKSLFKFGKHRGRYDALIQKSPVAVYRDNNKNDKFDDLSLAKPEMIGLNLHHSGNYEDFLKDVNKYSATCQVFLRKYEQEFFMDMIKRSINIWGDGFTYTLFEEKNL
jgi:hypothetical protein